MNGTRLMKCAMALAAAAGLAVFGWGAASSNVAVAKAPASQPARIAAPPAPTAAWGATAGPQTVTVVESGVVNFYLHGIGLDWTLVTAPQHGTLKLYGSDWALHEWTQGATLTFKRILGLKRRADDGRGDRGDGYVLYSATPGYVGPESFTWRSSDAKETSKDAVCSITVTANHAPVASNQSVTCVQGTENKYIALNYSHVDGGRFNSCRPTLYPGQTMTFTLVSGPAHGAMKYWNGVKGGYEVVSMGTPTPYYGWSYTPDAAYSGADSFSWKCNDTFVDSATVTASITVAPRGPAPATQPVVAFKEGFYTGPGDIVPDAMAWYGTRGYSRAVAATGTQKAVQIVRNSDGASMDVLIKPNGDLDTDAAATFCAGTLAKVFIWYDQSGHGNNVIGGCQPDQTPVLSTVSCKYHPDSELPSPDFGPGSLPCVEAPGDDTGLLNTGFVGASPVGTFSTVAVRKNLAQSWSLLMMMCSKNILAGFAFDQFAPNQAYLNVGKSPMDPVVGGTRIAAPVDETDMAVLHAFQCVINGPSSVINVDGTPTFGNLKPANLANSLAVECQGAFMGKMTESGVWPTAFSPDEQTAMYQNQQRYWHLPPTVAGVRRGTTTARYVKGKTPPIDGTVSSVWEWNSANRDLLLGKVESTEIGPLQTTAYVLMDKQNLYFACWCQEPNTDALVANATDRDGDLRNDDSVELFLSPDGKTYYHFAVNPKGVFSDGKGDLNQKEDLAWNSTATVKTSIDKDKTWTVTMSLPLSALGVTSGNNQTWMLNINRTKPVKDSAGNTTFIKSSWSSAGHSDYNDASGWGKLTGVNIP